MPRNWTEAGGMSRPVCSATLWSSEDMQLTYAKDLTA